MHGQNFRKILATRKGESYYKEWSLRKGFRKSTNSAKQFPQLKKCLESTADFRSNFMKISSEWLCSQTDKGKFCFERSQNMFGMWKLSSHEQNPKSEGGFYCESCCLWHAILSERFSFFVKKATNQGWLANVRNEMDKWILNCWKRRWTKLNNINSTLNSWEAFISQLHFFAWNGI